MKNKEEKVKNNTGKKNILGKFIAIFMLVAMVLGSCSTCIYYVVTSINK